MTAKTKQSHPALWFFDTLLSPPPDFSNYTYQDRLKQLWANLLRRRQLVRSAIGLARLSFMMLMSWIFYPIALYLKKKGYRFCNIDLSQIGSAIYFDLFLREDALKYQTQPAKLLVLASDFTDGNRYLYDLYAPYVTYVRNPFLKFLLSPFFVSNVFKDNSYKFGLVHFTETISHKIWNSFDRKTGGKGLVEFPERDKEKAENLLSKYLPKNQRFVALHVRDNGFYGIKSQRVRNADIHTYQDAIKYLIGEGYAVIRIGDPNMVDISEMKKECGALLFDYAYSDIKSEMMDIYLLSQCAFFIGLASGPASVPSIFGVNSVNVNWCTAANGPNFLEGDLTTFKKYRDKKDNSLVPFSELLKPPFDRNPGQKTLDENGAWAEDNSPAEILETVREYVEQHKITGLQKKAKAMLTPDNYAYGAKGHFSYTILKAYEEEGKLG